MQFLRIALRWTGKAVGGLVLLILLGVGVDVLGALTIGYPPVLAFVLHELPFRGKAFDRDAWQEAGSCAGLSDGQCAEKQETCPRGPMVRDLVRSHLLTGPMTRAEVSALLGPPDGTVRIAGESCDDYGLGMCSGLGWDYDSLYVCYAADGRVAKAGHVQH